MFNFDFKEIISVTLILFSVIDIVGSIPIIIDLRKKNGHVQSEKATIISGVLMFLFLFLGTTILNLFGIDIGSFAIAGALVMFLIGMEMILGIDIFKSDPESSTGSIIPLAFPLIAGAGTMTTLISLKAEYMQPNISVGIILNLIFVYIVLKSSSWLERKIGPGGIGILRKVFGIILLAIAIKLFKSNVISELGGVFHNHPLH
ncbi:MarC family protein [Xanthovirga aplysinae]|uniref:MarC family protein n=1 Tax=Xanthovirga aplysinae TaxID=2529853 RepID=UPI0012BCAFB9|nr:MarC family protein [Xanthovirga aplysinae]MTI29786.1 MarC family protein [Xanthovirga aplysinae]